MELGWFFHSSHLRWIESNISTLCHFLKLKVAWVLRTKLHLNSIKSANPRNHEATLQLSRLVCVYNALCSLSASHYFTGCPALAHTARARLGFSQLTSCCHQHLTCPPCPLSSSCSQPFQPRSQITVKRMLSFRIFKSTITLRILLWLGM